MDMRVGRLTKVPVVMSRACRALAPDPFVMILSLSFMCGFLKSKLYKSSSHVHDFLPDGNVQDWLILCCYLIFFSISVLLS